MVGKPASCSHSSRTAAEPLAGTAPAAQAWIVLEHPGPWGRDAIADSGLAPELVAYLTDALRTWGVRTVLSRHDDRRHISPQEPRNVWVASCSSSNSRGRHGILGDLREVLEWDPAAIASGQLPTMGQQINRPWEFICTHSKRDACCATLGRRYVRDRAAKLAEEFGDQKFGPWECSHLGGHRFAPTSLFLPSGRLYGRQDQFPSFEVLGEPPAAALRGASYLPPWEQAADQAVREVLDLSWSTDTDVETSSAASIDRHHEQLVRVAVPDHGSWAVHCVSSTVSSPASCGAESTTRTVWKVRDVTLDQE